MERAALSFTATYAPVEEWLNEEWLDGGKNQTHAGDAKTAKDHEGNLNPTPLNPRPCTQDLKPPTHNPAFLNPNPKALGRKL